MSWKATAYVKEIRKELTVHEKFVLLMLAEYHRTDDKETWPSLETLAEDCLMDRRSVYRILSRLEAGRYIRRNSGGGRGHRTAYQIAGVDYINRDRETGITETGIANQGQKGDPDGHKQGQKGDPAAHAIRINRELVLESNGGRSPDDFHPVQYATRLIEEIQASQYELSKSQQMIHAVREALEALVGGGKSLMAAFEYLLAVTLDGIDRGNRIDVFWFRDAKWRTPNGREPVVSRHTERTRRNQQTILDTITECAGGPDRVVPAKQPL